jgi:tRNA(fMet)-specific endonuclease VapC
MLDVMSGTSRNEVPAGHKYLFGTSATSGAVGPPIIDQLAVPALVLGELYAGAYKHEQSNRLLNLIGELLEEVYVIDFDIACAHQFGRLRGNSLRTGTLFSTVDLMIASVAIIHGLTLITHNTKDFENIPGLRFDDWLRD